MRSRLRHFCRPESAFLCWMVRIFLFSVNVKLMFSHPVSTAGRCSFGLVCLSTTLCVQLHASGGFGDSDLVMICAFLFEACSPMGNSRCLPLNWTFVQRSVTPSKMAQTCEGPCDKSTRTLQVIQTGIWKLLNEHQTLAKLVLC